MMDKFENFLYAVSGMLIGALMFVFSVGFLVTLILGNWDAATAFGIGHIGLQILVD